MDIPHFASDLIDTVLVLAIRQQSHVRSTNAGTTVAPILNVLPRDLLIHTNYAAILRMPWIDTDLACRLADFWLLDVMHNRVTRPPYSRPLQYKLPVALATASEQGRMDVLQWWIEQGLPVVRNNPTPFLAAGRSFDDDFLEFWASLIDLDTIPSSTITECLADACRRDDLETLAWWTSRRGSALDWKSVLGSVCIAIDGGCFNTVSCYLKATRPAQLLDMDDEATLLLVAILTDQPDIADFLVDDYGISLTSAHLDFACISGSISTLAQCAQLAPPAKSELHSQLKDASNAFFLACMSGNVELLAHLELALERRPTMIDSEDQPFFALVSIFLDLPSFAYLHDALEACFDWFDEDLLPANIASFMGHTNVLDWLSTACGRSLDFSQVAVECAAANGHLKVLQWWVQKRYQGSYDFDSSNEIVDKACANGHLHIAQYMWEVESCLHWGRPFLHTAHLAFPALAKGGFVDFGRWWVANIGKPEQTEIDSAVAKACAQGHLAFLEMMLDAQLLASVDDIGRDAMRLAAHGGFVDILDWWSSHSTAQQPRRLCLSWLGGTSWPAAFDVLDWMLVSGLPVVEDDGDESAAKAKCFAIDPDEDRAIGLVGAVSEAKTLYLSLCLDQALFGKQAVLFGLVTPSMGGQVAVLNWAARMAGEGKLKLAMNRVEDCLIVATEDRAYHVLQWWVTNVQFRGPINVNLGQVIEEDETMRDWWRQTGLVSEENLVWDAELAEDE